MKELIMQKEFKKWIDSLPKAIKSLENIQINGVRFLTEFNLPSRKDEEWRTTDIKRLEKIFHLSSSNTTKEKSYNEVNNYPKLPEGTYRLVLDSAENNIDLNQLPDCIEALNGKELDQYLVENLNTANTKDDWQLALNKSTTSNIVALKVKSKNTVSLELVISEKFSALMSSRVLIIIEEEAKLNLLEIILGSEKSAHSHLLEMHVCKKAKVKHGLIANGNKESIMLARLAIKQDRKSQYSLYSFQQNWFMSRLEPQISQLQGEAHTEIKGIQIANKNEEISTHSIVRFLGPNGSLEQLQKAIANEKSHSIFRGLVEVPQIAQKTNASQLSKNLLLSDKAKIDTKPELKIIADDVKCNHGATISQLEEDEIFYLQSRGISINQASSLLVKGYCNEILSKFPLEVNRWSFISDLLKK